MFHVVCVGSECYPELRWSGAARCFFARIDVFRQCVIEVVELASVPFVSAYVDVPDGSVCRQVEPFERVFCRIELFEQHVLRQIERREFVFHHREVEQLCVVLQVYALYGVVAEVQLLQFRHVRHVDFCQLTVCKVQLYQLSVVRQVYVFQCRILHVDELQLGIVLHVDAVQRAQSVRLQLQQQRTLRYIYAFYFLVHGHVEVQKVGLVRYVDGFQLVEVHVYVLHLVVLGQVYCRNLVVCGVVRVAFAVQIGYVAVYLDLRSFRCSVNESPRCLCRIFFQGTVSPVYLHGSVVVVCPYTVSAGLPCRYGERYAPLVLLFLEHSLDLCICGNGEQCVLHKFSINHYSLVVLALFGSVAHAQYRAGNDLSVAAHFVVVPFKGTFVGRIHHVAFHHLVGSTCRRLLRYHYFCHRTGSVALYVNPPMRLRIVEHKVFFCICRLSVRVLYIHVSRTVGVLYGLIHEVQRLRCEVFVALQVEVSQCEIVCREVEELKVARLCRQCLQPFQTAHFEPVDAD